MAEEKISLNQQRLGSVLSVLKASGAKRVLDLGCGEGRLLKLMLEEKSFTNIVGVDVSYRTLENAKDRLHMDRMSPHQKERIELIHGSLTYRDSRLSGYDAAAVVEVIEHLDPPRLASFERSLFEFARPNTVVLTTPNAEYNIMWETLPAGHFRHRDHRFQDPIRVGRFLRHGSVPPLCSPCQARLPSSATRVSLDRRANGGEPRGGSWRLRAGAHAPRRRPGLIE